MGPRSRCCTDALQRPYLASRPTAADNRCDKSMDEAWLPHRIVEHPPGLASQTWQVKMGNDGLLGW
jgi:hypothetical protein